ncbi:MAG: OFA family MFS transporter [Eubacteriaceae bacterium]|nr:OFA family MFS transporter [Eubacteriaceae bacterium]
MDQKKVNRWLVLLAGFTFNFCLSGTSAFSIFVKPMMLATGWEQGAIALSYTIYNIVLCIFGIVIGVIGPKLKARNLMYIGSALFALGWIITGFSTEVWMMQLGFGVVTGMGGGCLYNFSVTNTSKWFPDKKGFVSGLLLGGAAIGPVFCAPVATAVLGKAGVNYAYIIMGIIYAVLMFAVGWMVQVPAPDYKPEGYNPVVTAATNTSAKDYTWKEMMKTSTFYMLYLLFIFACTPSLMMLGAVASIGQDQAAMTPAMASLAVSLLAVFNFLGRLFFGSVSDKLGRYNTLLIALGVDLGAVLLLSKMTSPVMFMVVMCVVGACGGALLVMFPPITSDSFGVKNSGLNYSIMFSAYSISALLGPQLAAYYKRTQGTYTMAFTWAGILMGVAIVILLIVMGKRKKSVN